MKTKRALPDLNKFLLTLPTEIQRMCIAKHKRLAWRSADNNEVVYAHMYS